MQALHDYEGADRTKLLTPRQAQVLELVAKRRSLKQIAAELGISESAVNQHIKALKGILAVNSLPELAEAHRHFSQGGNTQGCRKTACTKSGVPQASEIGQSPDPDGLEQVVSFHDAIAYRVGVPWEVGDELGVVPKVLNSTNAKLARTAYILGIAVGMFILILTGLGVAQGISAMLHHEAGPSTRTAEAPTE
ncbi:helix-turn-helix transcriptional regulator [Novosphingobium sp.]|uniref:response regulator transcription factor n=1 Tax=Novosphingobium sp. TaxID=1874826 RepID=UPI001EBBDD57|nr:helix-turn-helix transcriptional regulator [Novosphingobium sp.]MBK9010201.1 helix-turn-helix transcriptional regulator [Novosphingobium sp.]